MTRLPNDVTETRIVRSTAGGSRKTLFKRTTFKSQTWANIILVDKVIWKDVLDYQADSVYDYLGSVSVEVRDDAGY